MSGAGPRVGAYPGSFNPPTLAHLAIARAAVDQGGLDAVDLVVSESALGKEDVSVPTVADRMEVLGAVAATRPWLGARLTPLRLLADIAADYDALIVGADKWAQLLDPSWYGGSIDAHHADLARLPAVLVAARGRAPIAAPPPALTAEVVRLEIEPALQAMSSTAVRAGRREWMLPEAAAWDRRHKGWSDPTAYAAGR